MIYKIVKNAFVNAGLTTGYVVGIASFLTYMPQLLGGDKMERGVFIPVIMLLILIVSVAITGFLVFGKPILWYLDGKKKESLFLLGYTLGFLILIIVFLISIF
ncbi:MAG TPA: hypothetical protein VJH21_00215 [Candidatus Paceibacterota bacterium]